MASAAVVEVDGIEVRLTSADRVIFPAHEGGPALTKRDVFAYYLAVGGRLLGAIGGRPTALERWPEGVHEGAEHFYQKHLPAKVPEYVHGAKVRFPSGRTGTLLSPDSRAAIAWAAQMGAITFHAWPVSGASPDCPDQLRIDLDPSPQNSFADVVEATRACLTVLDGLALPSFVKTSGGRGLHIYVPIVAQHSFVDARHAAIAIGRRVQLLLPGLITLSWWKEERGPRVFIDFNQNAQDRVMASAYSLRPRPGAPASMPFERTDLDGIEPADFTMRTVPGIIESTPDPWAGMADAAVDLAPVLDLWDEDAAAGLPELPYPPDFPKMPGEPPRVQPSRARAVDSPGPPD